MRIAYVGSPELFSRGASAIHVAKMCQAISNLGMKVDLIVPYFSPTDDLFSYYGVKRNFTLRKIFPSLRRGGPRHALHGALSSLYTALFRRSYDLALTRNITFTYLATQLFHLPTVYDAHHPLVNRAARFIFNSLKDSKYLLRFSTNSYGLAEAYLRLGLPKEKLVVAHNGVDLESFRNLPQKLEARKKVGLYNGNPDERIVCYSGNTYPGRGIELLVEVSRRLKDVRFVIIGGLEEDINRYRELAVRTGASNIELIGFVPHAEVPLYLSAADVLVMPYTTEMTIKGGTKAYRFTSPIKLFEYMACGRPIVATSLPSIREILEDGRNALLVEPNNADLLRRGIEEALYNRQLAEKISKEARKDASQYTWEQRAKKLILD